MPYERPNLNQTAKILSVDDEQMLADLINEWVEEKWECVTVYSGAEALETIDSSFDLVLLDRQMPEMSGDEVLEKIREMNLPVQVMMVSGVEPDVDIIELPIDDYLTKPIDRPELQEKTEGLLLRRTYNSIVEQFFVCAAKIEILQNSKSEHELEEDDRYLSLKAKADELRQSADATLGKMSKHVSEFHDIEADD